MIYTVKWGDSDDNAYHVEMTQAQFKGLDARLENSEEIFDHEIYPIKDTVNSYEDIIEVLEDYGLEPIPALTQLGAQAE